MSGTYAEPARPGAGLLGRLQGALGGAGFPAFAVTALGSFTLLTGALLLVPPAQDGLGAFAEQFRVWCFGYDAQAGTFQRGYLAVMLLNPLLLAAIILAVWWRPLRTALSQRRRALLAPAAAGLALVLGSGGGLVALEASQAPAGPPPFPADALRLTLTPPALRLTNQEGQEVDLAALRGRVVLLTAVYARCTFTCPMIMGQTKRAVDALSPEERAGLTVVGVTLDPARDDVATLAEMAAGQGIGAPLYNLVTGPPADVERVLDGLGITRTRDPATGEIDHANLFLLVDREGRIAYRLTIGDVQEVWLTEALRALLSEGAAAPKADPA